MEQDKTLMINQDWLNTNGSFFMEMGSVLLPQGSPVGLINMMRKTIPDQYKS